MAKNIFLLFLIFKSIIIFAEPLFPEKSIKLAIPEPSDLCITAEGDSMWCVSDKTGYLHRIDFEGNIKESFNYGFHDPEAVCLQDNFIWVVEERKNIANKIEGKKVIKRINLKKLEKKKNGPEGITFNPEKKEFYIATEKSPSVISVYDINFNFLREYKYKFSDISALCYDRINKYLWVLSHEDSAIYILDTEFKNVDSIKIKVVQAEGLALDYRQGYLYICSDKDALLHIYKIPKQFISASFSIP